jgi:geranylgeranyl pyrophosphate synthase
VTKNAETDTTLDSYLAARRREIDAALARYAPRAPETPAAVADAMQYSLMAGGKRLRPLLTLAAAEAVAGAAAEGPGFRPTITARSNSGPAPPARANSALVPSSDLTTAADAARALAMPAACAIEMIHTYSLIHDDLPAMDDDTLRRGQPTLHVVVGDGLAILAGDGLQAEAFSLLAREPVSDDVDLIKRKLRVIRVIADAAGPSGMVGGQAIDLGAVRPGQPPGAALDHAGIEAMHARKTGALIRAAAVAGAVMAGGDDRVIAAIDGYASEIGLAFQIVDDVLDVEAGSAALGKTAGKDAAAGKPTYPSLFGIERSRALAAACLVRAEQSLAEASLATSNLLGIAHWIVDRQS